MRTRIGCSLAMLTLLGCGIEPRTRPVVAVPDRFLRAAPEAAPRPVARWWTQFKDPVLDELVQAALDGNGDLRMATAQLAEYRAYYLATGAPLAPQFTLNATDASTRTGDEPTSRSRSVGVALAWELDFWGRIRNLSAAAYADYLGQEQARQAILLSLVASVTTSYIQVRELDFRLESGRLTLAARKESERLAELRYREGLSSELELRQATTEYQGTLLSVQQLEMAVAQKEHELSLLLGHNPGPIKRGLAIDALAGPAIPGALPSELLTRRPDLLQAEQALRAADARVGAARASLFPTISLTGSGGFVSPQLSGLFTGPNRTWTFLPAISLPIFDGGGLRAQLRATKARREQALAGYQKAVQAAFRETEDALVASRSLNQQRATQARLVDEVRRYAFLARLRYENGITSNLEVLDSQRNQFSAEQGLAQIQSAALVATVTLYKALGGDWGTAQPPPPRMP